MEKKTVSPSSPLDSRVSLTEPNSPSVHTPFVETPRQSISTANGTDSVKAAVDKEYLKNVLVQFFEHKDKRV
jgi:GRIP domain